MRKPESPCENCTTRHEKCHSDCKFYEWYRNLLDEYKENISRVKEVDNKANDYTSDTIKRLAKRKRK